VKENNCGFTLLVADDEAAILKGLCTNIPWQDINVRVVGASADGLTAFNAIARLSPDIAIVDICMPRCDGLDLIEKAHKADLKTEFIILSGYENFSYAKRAMTFGVTSYLLKPINKNELMETVRRKCESISMHNHQMEHESFLQQKLAESGAMLRRKLLSDIAFGHLRDKESISTQAQELQLSLKPESMYVIILQCEPGKEAELPKLINSAFWSCTYELFGNEAGCVYKAINTGPSFSAKESIKRLLGDVISEASARGIHMIAAIGTLADNFLELPPACRSAQQALAYQMYELSSSIYDIADINFAPLQASAHESMNNSGIAEAILLNDTDALAKALDSFFQSLFYIPMPPPSFIRGMCVYLATDVHNRIISYVKERQVIDIHMTHSQIHALATISELKQWILKLFTEYAKIIASDGLFKYDPIIDEAKRFIDENLLGKLLLNDVAKHVHLSESYFASLFRAYAGQSFRNYLLNAKLCKAKEMLRVSHMSISDVSDMLGYEDYRAFTRAFKKYTGHNPSDLYRHPEKDVKSTP
jgi:two-component system response regulator YesN